VIDPRSFRTVFMGTPEFALPTLEGLLAAGLPVIGVYTQPDRPSGRGKQLTPPPVKQLATAHSLPLFQPVRLRLPEVVAELQALAPT